MMEARIECMCHDYEITDLGWKLSRGDVKWLSKAKADASSELKHAVAIKALVRRDVDRGTKAVENTPPWLRRRGAVPPQVRPRRQAPPTAPPTPPVATAPAAPPNPPSLTADDIRRITREEVRSEVRKAVGKLPTAEGGLTKTDVADVLREVLGTLPVAAAAPPAAVAPVPSSHSAPVDDDDEDLDEPVMFIPSDLSRPSELASDINVQSSASGSSSSFDEAAKAMKAAAPKRKRRSRKKKVDPSADTDGEAG